MTRRDLTQGLQRMVCANKFSRGMGIALLMLTFALPTINGVAAQIAWRRRLTAQTFSELQPAVNWLNAFSSNIQCVVKDPPSPQPQEMKLRYGVRIVSSKRTEDARRVDPNLLHLRRTLTA
jgi:hypothetical protein